jgi:hypothetical protein
VKEDQAVVAAGIPDLVKANNVKVRTDSALDSILFT